MTGTGWPTSRMITLEHPFRQTSGGCMGWARRSRHPRLESRRSTHSVLWMPLMRMSRVSNHPSWIDPDSDRNPGRLYRAVRQP